MQAARVQWQASPSLTQTTCHLCGNTENNHLVLQAQHFCSDLGYLDLAHCGHCKSTWFIDAASKNAPYPDTEVVLKDPNFIYLIHHYLEIVGGLDWKVPLLERLPFERFNSVLEIGCNAGVTLDYCRTMWPAQEVLGLEPSAYGVVGARQLELSILPQYLHTAPSLVGKRFDFIYATEVLEHVAEPVKFLQQIYEHLSDTGILLLTTPRSEAINCDTPPGELYAALSPGSHYFMLSAKQLKQLAADAGFEHCYHEPFGMTRVAILSKQTFKLGPFTDSTARIAEYYRLKSFSDSLYARTHLGHLLNYHNYLVRAGKQPTAELQQSIDQLIQQVFELDLSQPQAFIERLLATHDLISFGKVMPYSLPFYLVARVQSQVSLHAADRLLLELAKLITLKGLKVDFQNLFVYHQLFETISAMLKARAPQDADGSTLAELSQKSAKLQATIPELTPAPLVLSMLPQVLKKQAKTKFFRLAHASFTKLRQQFA